MSVKYALKNGVYALDALTFGSTLTNVWTDDDTGIGAKVVGTAIESAEFGIDLAGGIYIGAPAALACSPGGPITSAGCGMGVSYAIDVGTNLMFNPGMRSLGFDPGSWHGF